MKTLFDKLKKALEKDENVIFAYVFGSYVNGIPTSQSDVDVAVYFKNPPRGTEILDYTIKLSNFLNKYGIYKKHLSDFDLRKRYKPILAKPFTVNSQFNI